MFTLIKLLTSYGRNVPGEEIAVHPNEASNLVEQGAAEFVEEEPLVYTLPELKERSVKIRKEEAEKKERKIEEMNQKRLKTLHLKQKAKGLRESKGAGKDQPVPVRKPDQENNPAPAPEPEPESEVQETTQQQTANKKTK